MSTSLLLGYDMVAHRLLMIVIDATIYPLGTRGNALSVPILAGEHRFEVRALE